MQSGLQLTILVLSTSEDSDSATVDAVRITVNHSCTINIRVLSYTLNAVVRRNANDFDAIWFSRLIANIFKLEQGSFSVQDLSLNVSDFINSSYFLNLALKLKKIALYLLLSSKVSGNLRVLSLSKQREN
jgi:hypothetical protein